MRRKMFAIASALIAGAGIAHAQAPATGLTPNSGGPSATQNSGGSASALLTPNPSAATQGQGTVDGWGNSQCPNCTPSCCQQSSGIHGWLSADYLLFFPQSQSLAAGLVTTGGAETVGTTTTFPIPVGLRIDTGMWFDPQETKGSQTIIDTIFRTQTTINFGAGSTINTNGGANSFTITAPSSYTTWLQYGDSDFSMMRRILNNDTTRVYFLYGTKVAYLEEDAKFQYVLGAAGVPSANFLDEFHTRDGFLGGQVGFLVKSDFGRFTADLAAKCALGINYSSSTTLGSNNAGIAVPGTGGAAVGANTQVFTNDNNIGYREAGYFSVIPEINGNLSYHVNDRLSVRVGYSFTAWTNVIRAGDQITPTLAPIAGIGGVHTAPAFPSTTSTFFIHGLNFGAELKY